MIRIAPISLVVLAAAGAGLAACVDAGERAPPGGREQQQAPADTDADLLYDFVEQTRAELRAMRVAAGLGAYAAGPAADEHESPEHGEGTGERGGREARGEGSESGGGEHGAIGDGGGEESAFLPMMTRQDRIFADGIRLVLKFDPETQVFVGSVTNTTARTLPEVRVEIHLDNGAELGPTMRIDIEPGQTVPVALGAFGQRFGSWVSHPEAGVERGHGTGGDEGGEGHRAEAGREKHSAEGADTGWEGTHGSGGAGNRPLDPTYRPLYNQLQVLRGEMHAFAAGVGARTRPAAAEELPDDYSSSYQLRDGLILLRGEHR